MKSTPKGKPKIFSLNTSKNYNTFDQTVPTRIGFIQRLKLILTNKYVLTIDIVVTLWILYANDLKLLYTNKNTDSIFTVFSFIAMGVMIAEMITLFVVDENGYSCSVYNIIDICAIISLVLDLHFTEKLFKLEISPLSTSNESHTMSLIDITMGVRILSRCLRFEKFMFSSKTKKEMKFESVLNQRLILFISLIIITSIFTNPDVYCKTQMEKSFSLKSFETAEKTQLKKMFDIYQAFQEKTPFKLFYVSINNETYIDRNVDLDKKRMIEYFEYLTDEKEAKTLQLNLLHFVFDNRYNIELSSKLNMGRTSALLLIVIFGMIIFNRSVNKLAIEPTMKMIETIKNLSTNPADSLLMNVSGNKKKKENTSFEVKMLGKAINKLCGLVSLGFGEAGSEIISSVVKKNVEADMNLMDSSQIVMGIYGFCDIRNFTDTTEVLQENVMRFVNEVAEIVHEISAEYLGAANKNIGDAFLMVWKFEKKYTRFITDKVTGEKKLILKKMWEVNQIIDMSLIAFIKIIIQIKKSKKLVKYSINKGLNARMPGYQVRLGFGLHVGYSIEGPVGSPFKIDTSYLSPNVDLAGAIQEKTKDFHTELILSREFVEYLSPKARAYTTLLDDKEEGGIYTVHLNLQGIMADECLIRSDNSINEELNQKMNSIKEKKDKAKRRLDDAIYKGCDIWDEFEKEEEFQYLKKEEKK